MSARLPDYRKKKEKTFINAKSSNLSQNQKFLKKKVLTLK